MDLDAEGKRGKVTRATTWGSILGRAESRSSLDSLTASRQLDGHIRAPSFNEELLENLLPEREGPEKQDRLSDLEERFSAFEKRFNTFVRGQEELAARLKVGEAGVRRGITGEDLAGAFSSDIELSSILNWIETSPTASELVYRGCPNEPEWV